MTPVFLIYVLSVLVLFTSAQIRAQNVQRSDTNESPLENTTESTHVTKSSLEVFVDDIYATPVSQLTQYLSNGAENTTTTYWTPDDSSTASTTDPSPTTTTEKPCDDLLPPENITTTSNQTCVGLSVSITYSDDREVCMPKNLTVSCWVPPENNHLWEWVIRNRTETFDLRTAFDNDTANIDVIVDGLSEFTNYSCGINLTSLSSISDAQNVSFTTNKTVPDSPRNLTITYLGQYNFSLTWKEPYKIPAVLEGYVYELYSVGVGTPSHYISENCSYYLNTTKSTRDLFLNLYNVLPDIEYSFTVWALTDVGGGERSTISVVTETDVSLPPENLLVEFTENNDIYNNVTITEKVSWEMPCNTNGPVLSFLLNLNGTYIEGEEVFMNITDNRSAEVTYEGSVSSYSYEFPYIMPSSIYALDVSLFGKAFQGRSATLNFTSEDNYPSAPNTSTSSITNTSFSLIWNKPENRPGKIISYIIEVQAIAPAGWTPIGNCNVNHGSNIRKEFNGSTFTYYHSNALSSFSYRVNVTAVTQRGQGNRTVLGIDTYMSLPEPVEIVQQSIINTLSENYNAVADITFTPNCFNGPFKQYLFRYVGNRNNQRDIGYIATNNDLDTELTFPLKAEYTYKVDIVVYNYDFNRTSDSVVFTAPAGVPKVNESSVNPIISIEGTSKAVLTLNKDDFDENNGEIRFIAVIVSNQNVTGGEYSIWNTSEWPVAVTDEGVYYEATPPFWNPFSNLSIDSIDFVIGEDQECTADQHCNKPLSAETGYYVILRIFTNGYYRNSWPVSFKTAKLPIKLGLILGVIFGLLAGFIIGFLVFLVWKKGYFRDYDESKLHYLSRVENRKNDRSRLEALLPSYRWQNRPVIKESLGSPTEIPQKAFVDYCKLLEDNPDIVKAQWAELEEKSKQIYDETENHFATLPENRRKNRYTDILPFDHTRVKLQIDEDDEICSDYINASHITGFTNKNHYIATQGPLPGTCRDFWKMIIQENVSVIVMVTHFRENNRDKCYKYFPNNHETMTIGDDLEVRCSTELHFGIYCVRTLQVKKDLKQISVTHMQFLEWPDFGVPNGTESMLHFCHQFQERWTVENGIAVEENGVAVKDIVAVVHCSAGVGRTGTLIATDILLRAINAGKNIDIFNTVLDLRRQRRKMVQTEKQYMYIYSLLKTMIEDPIVDEDYNQEHFYENVELDFNIKRDGLKNKIAESAL